LAITDAEVKFGLIPKEHWVQPTHIDEKKASEAREQMVKDGVIYGGMLDSMALHNSFSECGCSGSVP
jgi:alpha 1,2-mannosyltransferase